MNISEYKKGIEAIDPKKATERSYYPMFYNLLDSMLPSGTQIITEAKKIIYGKPDFTVLTSKGKTLGYIEAKRPGTNIESIETSEQIVRYIKAFPNFILTNFHDYRLYHDGKMVYKVCIDDWNLIDNTTKSNGEEFKNLMHRFASGNVVKKVVAKPKPKKSVHVKKIGKKRMIKGTKLTDKQKAHLKDLEYVNITVNGKKHRITPCRVSRGIVKR